MDLPRSTSANGEDVGIPDDLRCKRSDGKQWRCTAMSMPDKTVCEKHYIQAKKRAANSAMRAHLKKAKRKSMEEGDLYLEDKSDDFDAPMSSGRIAEQSHPVKKSSKSQVRYSPDTPPTRSLPVRNSSKHEDSQRDLSPYEENWRPYKTNAADSLRNLSQKSFDANATTEYSDASTNSSEEIGGQTCHQCRRNERDGVVWCLRCDRRGYCSNCISKWYLDIPLEEIQKICPACRGICNCRACLRGGNLIKVRIREIPVLDKLQYLYCLLSSVLPVIKQIHAQQCFEVEVEKRIVGDEMLLLRAKLNADEQMCCNFCRIPIIDYHRHCPNCYYDLCLNCCQDLREASTSGNGGLDNVNGMVGEGDKTLFERQYRQRLKFSDKILYWKADCDGNIPCPPREYGGCGYFQLSLNRIFKMNWVAKLVKNVEEMVGGCRVHDFGTLPEAESDDPSLLHCADRDNSSDNFLYCPTSSDIKFNGISNFRKHWAIGKPIIVRQVFDNSSIASWDPETIWRGIQGKTEERMKYENQLVKAINSSDQSEVNIELLQFIEGYFDGRISESGRPEMLKLKDWPSPSESEDFILYQRPEFIVKLPLLEYIHSKWGLLNVAAKLPHYSLQNDVGPKIFICYGAFKEHSAGDSVNNLSINMRDMVYLLVHSHLVKPKDAQGIDIECMENANVKSVVNELHSDEELCSGDGRSADIVVHGHGLQDEHEARNEAETEVEMLGQKMESNSVDEQAANSKMSDMDVSEKSSAVIWDVFRRKDVPKLTEYLRLHWKEFRKPVNINDDLILRPLYDGALYLDGHHKGKLKHDFGVEPWTFEQRLGEAVFVPSGCPFQVVNLQSNVQLGLDFLSPESVGEAARMAAEVRCLPNDHEAKLQVLEVGKISLYAASSVIKEVQKLVLDPKLSEELGVGDPNLTAAVSENLENMTKQSQISCA
ncbi:lysine-specific demethylase JMJ25 [Cucumis sativus]|nr:lysine-specific demethylase JMJ25 [Cucumis sativus]KAE8651612.1 hypothetical protein Csa_021162 [Cucumis sativus]